MNLNKSEMLALSDPTLPHMAFCLYVKCFRQFMSYKTGEVFISQHKMIDSLLYTPKLKSREKYQAVTRGKIRQLIECLIDNELITVIKKGNATKGICTTFKCLLATFDSKITSICANQQQPKCNQVQQPDQQPIKTYTGQGLQEQQQPNQQPMQNAQQQPISEVTDININNNTRDTKIYKKIDLTPFLKFAPSQALKNLIDHRATKNPKQTQHAFKLQVDQIKRSNEIGMTAEELIDFTIFKGWLSVNINYTINALESQQHQPTFNRPPARPQASIKDQAINEALEDTSWADDLHNIL